MKNPGPPKRSGTFIQKLLLVSVHNTLDCLLNGTQNVLITGAAAQVTGQQLTQLVVGVLLAGLDDLDSGHDEAGGAETTLDSSFLDESFLDSVQLAVGAQQAFQSTDFLALDPNCQVQAGVDSLTIDQDVAGAAFADLAALLDGVHLEIVTQHIGQGCANVNGLLNRLAIQGEL